ncbi:SPW repeat domain-containing protein [Cryptosporangium japonicum]|uniref:SPW repeat-containing integral membrane domain-containing protein n=1 Tax=Cryptosporangium japonicum TaxID=80872 RepID=A0ABN0TG14_9ACTN
MVANTYGRGFEGRAETTGTSRIGPLDGLVAAGLVLGAFWLVVAPSVLGYGSAIPGLGGMWRFGGTWNDATVGALLFVLVTGRLSFPEAASWCLAACAVLGGWLTLAPFALGYDATFATSHALRNDVLIGAVVAVLGVTGVAAAVRR